MAQRKNERLTTTEPASTLSPSLTKSLQQRPGIPALTLSQPYSPASSCFSSSAAPADPLTQTPASSASWGRLSSPRNGTSSIAQARCADAAAMSS